MSIKWVACSFLAVTGACLGAKADTLVGKAAYWYGPIRLYEAELRSTSGQFDWHAPFELELTYDRAFSAKDLAEASIKEMKRMGFAIPDEQLADHLQTCFADVSKGDTITGKSLSEDAAMFFLNGSKRCEVKAPGFRRAFFSIWLGEQARYRSAAARLTGSK